MRTDLSPDGGGVRADAAEAGVRERACARERARVIHRGVQRGGRMT